MLVLECNFHVGFKQVPTNVRMTRGKIEGGGFPFKSIFFCGNESSLRFSNLQSVVTLHTLTSMISPSLMSPPLLYLETLENKCSQCISPSLLSHLPRILSWIWTLKQSTKVKHHIVIIAMLHCVIP